MNVGHSSIYERSSKSSLSTRETLFASQNFYHSRLLKTSSTSIMQSRSTWTYRSMRRQYTSVWGISSVWYMRSLIHAMISSSVDWLRKELTSPFPTRIKDTLWIRSSDIWCNLIQVVLQLLPPCTSQPYRSNRLRILPIKASSSLDYRVTSIMRSNQASKFYSTSSTRGDISNWKAVQSGHYAWSFHRYVCATF